MCTFGVVHDDTFPFWTFFTNYCTSRVCSLQYVRCAIYTGVPVLSSTDGVVAVKGRFVLIMSIQRIIIIYNLMQDRARNCRLTTMRPAEIAT